MTLRITQYGEPVLKQKGELITVFDEKLKQLAHGMFEVVLEEEALGIAAQQVGEAIQLTAIDAEYCQESENETAIVDGKALPLELITPLFIVNPRIEYLDDEWTASDEGCLSFPGITFKDIVRRKSIRLYYQDLDGVQHVLETDKFLGRCIQHEIDHLNGILLVDHIDTLAINKIANKLKKLKRESRDFLKSQKKK